MRRVLILTAAQQVAAHLREELLRGEWSGRMPGGDKLAFELGVGRDTVESALRALENEGLLQNRGRRRGRTISLPNGRTKNQGVRVGILLSEDSDKKLDYILEIQHRLADAGHRVFFAKPSMTKLEMNVSRIARAVKNTVADAWVVLGGSREVLQWFTAQEKPAFALFGRRRGLKIAGAGPDKPNLVSKATRSLIELGHRRIVLLARERRRLPQPGASEQAFLTELAAHGIAPTAYHLPHWIETPEGFNRRLESLFSLTPPSAMIIQEAEFYVATLQFCANHGLRVPQDVSLVCTDSSPVFEWCKPTVAHIHWDSRPIVNRIVRWAANVSRGRADHHQTLSPAAFVPGGSMGPAADG